MTRWKLYLGLFVLFLSGIIVGVIGSGLVIHRKAAQIAAGGPLAARQVIIKRATKRLTLDEQQQLQLGAILKEKQLEWLRIRRNVTPKIHRVLEEVQAEFSVHLNEKQRELLKEDMNRLNAVRQRWDQLADKMLSERTTPTETPDSSPPNHDETPSSR